MRRLLQERTWCGNYVIKRSGPNSNGSSNCLFVLCVTGLMRWNKEFCVDQREGFHRAERLPVAHELE